jgi:Rrf2 family protein
MKIGYKCDYALKAILELSSKYLDNKEGVVSIQELAKLGDMPMKFLEHILLALKKGGFLNSKRGIKGGFSLARPPSEITVGDVARFIEGPIAPISCIEEENYGGCNDIRTCIFRDVWKEVANSISLVIDTLTFEELTVRYKEKKLNLKNISNYVI